MSKPVNPDQNTSTGTTSAPTATAGSGEPLVVIDGLWKAFGELVILKDVSLSVNRGDVTVLIGPSGSGKSTLLRCVNQLERIQAGSIRIDGELQGYEQEHLPAAFPHWDGVPAFQPFPSHDCFGKCHGSAAPG